MDVMQYEDIFAPQTMNGHFMAFRIIVLIIHVILHAVQANLNLML